MMILQHIRRHTSEISWHVIRGVKCLCKINISCSNERNLKLSRLCFFQVAATCCSKCVLVIVGGHLGYLGISHFCFYLTTKNTYHLNCGSNTQQHSNMSLSLSGPPLKEKIGAKHCVHKTIKSTLTTAIFHQQHTGQRALTVACSVWV